jgi:hypothetical protein
MNLIETIGAIALGIITIALVAVTFQPGSTAPAVFTAGGNAFSTSIKAATLKG